MNGLTGSKPFSWVKHAVRRWKELYYEILDADGQTDWVNPLSAIFSHDILAAKAVDAPPKVTESMSTKQESTPSSKPTSTSKSSTKTKQKRGQSRFFLKIEEIQAFLFRPSNLF